MRLHRIIGSGVLAVAVLFSTSGTALAEPKPRPLAEAALAASGAASNKSVTYSASASASTTEHFDARRANDIVSTSMRFDTNLIHVTIATQGDIVIDEHNWAAAQFSFNKSSIIDGIVVTGAIDGSAVSTVAVNRLGWECSAMSRIDGNEITLSVDSTCMGHPGAVAYNVMYGDFVSYAEGSSEAVDVSPSDGTFTQPACEPGGYWLLGADGGVFGFGDAGFYGSTGNLVLNAPVVAMTASATGKGYRFVASDGGVFSYGDASFRGSMGGKPLNEPVVGMASSESGNGYWLVASDGGIFAFGDAKFHGSMGGSALNRPIVGMTPTISGNGYWLVASDGGIFAFGDAKFYGSTGSSRLVQPITAMTVTESGNGYRLLAADGGVFAFGDATFLGSGVGRVLGATTTIASQPNGYLMADELGGVYEIGPIFHFGDLVDFGILPNEPIVSMAVLPDNT